MVTALNIKTENSFDLDEFLHYVELNCSVHDREGCLDAAPALRKLANNKVIFRRAALETLKQALGESQLIVAPAYMILGSSEKGRFLVRANLWPALRPEAPIETRNTFSYDLKHDHNFSFLTTNYFGPGYTTRVWRNPNGGRTAMNVGDVANLEYQGEFQLTSDTVLYFERGTDIHIQDPPKLDSVSLNIVVRDEEDLLYPQHSFEAETGKVIGYPVGSTLTKKLAFARLLSTSDDPEMIDVLEWASKSAESAVYKHALSETRTQLIERLKA